MVAKVEKQKDDGDYTVFSVRAPKTMVQAIEHAANRKNWSRNFLIVYLLEKALKLMPENFLDDPWAGTDPENK